MTGANAEVAPTIANAIRSSKRKRQTTNITSASEPRKHTKPTRVAITLTASRTARSVRRAQTVELLCERNRQQEGAQHQDTGKTTRSSCNSP